VGWAVGDRESEVFSVRLRQKLGLLLGLFSNESPTYSLLSAR
jgi:hypothetical protein